MFLHFRLFSFFCIFIFVAIKWYRSNNESCEGNDIEDPDVDFEQLVNQAEEGEDEDWGLPPELKRMVEQEDREVKPHQEETKIVNLGVGEERKEVKVGTSMSTHIRDELVALLRDPRHLHLVIPRYARLESRNRVT